MQGAPTTPVTTGGAAGGPVRTTRTFITHDPVDPSTSRTSKYTPVVPTGNFVPLSGPAVLATNIPAGTEGGSYITTAPVSAWPMASTRSAGQENGAPQAGKTYYGADDNASGTCGMLELVRRYAAMKERQGRRIVFCAFSAEEKGLYGSMEYVKHPPFPLDTTAFMINMDMIGRLKDALILQGVGSSSVWAREIEQRNAVVGLSITPIADTYLPTDATSFYVAGVPILAAFTGSHEEYHSPRDTADLINYKGLYDVTRLMSLFARSQANAATPPDYIKVEQTQTQGRVGNVFLGTIPDYASENIKGVKISGVVQGGPAAKAGLQGGDVIVGLGGHCISGRGGQVLQRHDRGRFGKPDRRLVAVVDLATVLAAAQPVLQLGHCGLERGIETVGARFAAHHRTAAARGDLDVLAVLALSTVLLVVKLDIEQVDGSIEALHPGQLLGNIDAEVFRDLDIAALDHNISLIGQLWFVVDDDHSRAVSFHGLG